MMFDFECPACDNFSAVSAIENFELEEGEAFVTRTMIVKCPKCGRVYRVIERYAWDGQREFLSL